MRLRDARKPILQLREREIQQVVIQFYRSLGVAVYCTSSNRRARIAKGMPDLYCLHPRRGGWWHEVKTPGGVWSEAQQEFAMYCQAAGVPYVRGGLDAAQTFFNALPLPPCS